MLNKLVIVLISALFIMPYPTASAAETDQVKWKLVFNQLFALEIKKEWKGLGKSDADVQKALRQYTAYTPSTFNQTIDKVLTANTSSEAYKIRRSIYDNPNNYAVISNLDFTNSIPAAISNLPQVRTYLDGITQYSNRSIKSGENFFASPEARSFMDAISTVGSRPRGQKVALVLVPGYAAHAIKFGIFPEIIGDMNLANGRTESRPILDEGNGFDIKYQDYTSYYSTHNGPVEFDIISPAGWEMGNTVGFNSETSDLLAKWIKGLPAHYSEHKLILLGYSKGAPIIFEFLQRHPEMKSRVIGLLTYGAVIQGTHVGRSGGKDIRAVLGKRSIGELIDNLKEQGLEESIDRLAPFIAGIDMSFLKIRTIKDLMTIFDVDSEKLDDQVDRLLEGREVRELLDGIDDLAPYTRTAWNLRYFDNNLVNPGTFMLNMSAVTDISSFASRPSYSNVRQRKHALLTPSLSSNGKILWKEFSLDAWFLYMASMDGFKQAPGGLYDTQVELQHTKSPWLDQSPLTASLTMDELKQLWNEVDIRKKVMGQGISSFSQFSNTPRAKLLRPSTHDHLNAYDLGEIKGHHWSLFLQAFRAPPDVSQEFAVWDFPRKAFMRALLQTFGLYNVIYQSPS